MNSLGKLFSVLLAIIIPAAITFASVTPSSAQPSKVWVDDDYCEGCPNDGHTWGYDAFDEIQDGIDAVALPGAVHVAAGIYYENIILRDAVQVLGAGANASTIDGGMNGSVVTASSVGPDTVLEGFKITNGTGTWRDSYTYGGGIYVSNSSSLIVRESIITGNRASDGAGGIEAYDSTISLHNNNISQNSGWWGGAITLHGADAEIVGNIIDQNESYYGGAIFVADSSQAAIVNNQITGTSNPFYLSPGIGIGESSTADIMNNTIAGILGNGIATGTYEVDFGVGSATITNCILWGNDDDLVNLTATYSDIEDGDPGEGNITADPLFVGSGDYHLTASSPCKDTGTSEGAPKYDIDGDPRPKGAGYDMGSDEYFPVNVFLTAGATVIPRGGTLALQATIANNTDKAGIIRFATKVTLPNENPYPPSGYLFGPKEVTLNPYQSKAGHFAHTIPMGAPLGTYMYHGYIGRPGMGIIDEDQFDFEVIEAPAAGGPEDWETILDRGFNE